MVIHYVGSTLHPGVIPYKPWCWIYGYITIKPYKKLCLSSTVPCTVKRQENGYTPSDLLGQSETVWGPSSEISDGFLTLLRWRLTWQVVELYPCYWVGLPCHFVWKITALFVLIWKASGFDLKAQLKIIKDSHDRPAPSLPFHRTSYQPAFDWPAWLVHQLPLLSAGFSSNLGYIAGDGIAADQIWCLTQITLDFLERKVFYQQVDSWGRRIEQHLDHCAWTESFLPVFGYRMNFLHDSCNVWVATINPYNASKCKLQSQLADVGTQIDRTNQLVDLIPSPIMGMVSKQLGSVQLQRATVGAHNKGTGYGRCKEQLFGGYIHKLIPFRYTGL